MIFSLNYLSVRCHFLHNNENKSIEDDLLKDIDISNNLYSLIHHVSVSLDNTGYISRQSSEFSNFILSEFCTETIYCLRIKLYPLVISFLNRNYLNFLYIFV